MQELQNTAETALKSLLESLGFEAEIIVSEVDGIVNLAMETPDAKFLIGEDGDRLDDLQYLVNRMVQRTLPDAPRVKIDCDHYRERSESKILEKARSLAQKAMESGKPMRMQPLNAYHRRLVHNELKEMGGVATSSEEGDARYKRITISPM
ncbi:MAG: R3H domain-containing nucleic acid-binding protein [Akkermansia sp.]